MLVLGQRGEAHEIGGGIILPKIRPHAIEAAVIHEIGFLETGLARLDVGGGHEERAIGGDKAVGKGRRLLVGKDGRPTEYRESHNGNGQ